jgi:iron(III) transport system substrate-binding protein
MSYRCLGSLLLCLLVTGCGSSANKRVVVYCALDREFAEPILRDFTAETGLQVEPRWDSEANKSVGLYEDLVRERDRPRCDVHWNNEIVATIRLQREGILAPYQSPAAVEFPAAFKAKDATWTAFAARARILLVNTKLLPNKEDWPTSFMDGADPKWRGKFAMARPQFGTTATHAACLFHLMGHAKTEDFYRKLKDNDVVVLPGNKQVAMAVGSGKVPFGVTDTDDAYAELDEGKPVKMMFFNFSYATDRPETGTLYIPNTVALIKNCPNPEGGKKLIDYLLRPAVEAKLAKSTSRQIPLNPAVKLDGLDLGGPDWDHYGKTVDFNKVADEWDEAQKFLAKEFAPR